MAAGNRPERGGGGGGGVHEGGEIKIETRWRTREAEAGSLPFRAVFEAAPIGSRVRSIVNHAAEKRKETPLGEVALESGFDCVHARFCRRAARASARVPTSAATARQQSRAPYIVCSRRIVDSHIHFPRSPAETDKSSPVSSYKPLPNGELGYRRCWIARRRRRRRWLEEYRETEK